MRCDQCKYWDKEENKYSDTPLAVSLCNKPVALWDATDWPKERNYNCGEKRIIKKQFKNLKMFVQDGSDYRAMLYTKADFGCIHFEKMD